MDKKYVSYTTASDYDLMVRKVYLLEKELAQARQETWEKAIEIVTKALRSTEQLPSGKWVWTYDDNLSTLLEAAKEKG